MEHTHTLPSSIQNILQLDEEVLWWEYPDKKHIRVPLQFTEILLDVIITSTFTYIIFLLILHFIIKISFFHFFSIYVLLSILIINYLNLQTQTIIRANKNRPKYHKYTVYVITNKRIIITIEPPEQQPSYIIYLPEEIDQPISNVRPDGNGSIIFGEPRLIRANHSTIAGSFIGITNVQQVAAMIQALKDDYESLQHGNNNPS